ncbi:hypothetical protein ACFFLM_19305 [Deinococcus oregonensis]|uniref:IrrE N-terminal-like domain-containing protein n=1 Tax=Deinococcus oregonensis TaxID=1805970 RepID=A0ABV6B2Y3_9DEIO
MSADAWPALYIQFVKDIQAYLEHEPNSYKALHRLGIHVRMGRDNYVITQSKPPVVYLQPWFYGYNNETVEHEYGHILLAWSNIESQMIQEYGSREAAQPFIESLCEQALPFLRITQPMVDEAVRRYGVTSRAVVFLMLKAKARPEVALRRLIYDHPNAERAGFITSGNYIREVARCNLGLPFSWLERVPEPSAWFPSDIPVSFTRIPHTHNLIGVVAG